MNAGGAHFGEAFHAPLRAALPAAGAPFSIRILINWRRPHLAIDASGDARADRPCVRRDKRPRLTGIPGFAWSPVLFRRGLCRRDHSNNRQRSCVHGQCEKPYRKFADAPLPLRRNTTKIGLQMGNANPNATRARIKYREERFGSCPPAGGETEFGQLGMPNDSANRGGGEAARGWGRGKRGIGALPRLESSL